MSSLSRPLYLIGFMCKKYDLLFSMPIPPLVIQTALMTCTGRSVLGELCYTSNVDY